MVTSDYGGYFQLHVQFWLLDRFVDCLVSLAMNANRVDFVILSFINKIEMQIWLLKAKDWQRFSFSPNDHIVPSIYGV